MSELKQAILRSSIVMVITYAVTTAPIYLFDTWVSYIPLGFYLGSLFTALVIIILSRKEVLDKYCYPDPISDEMKAMQKEPIKEQFTIGFIFISIPYVVTFVFVKELLISWENKKQYVLDQLLGD